MVEITLKIDGKDQISISKDGELVALNTQEIPDQAILSPIHPRNERNYDTFMLNNTQFIRVGNVYAMISSDDIMTEVGRSKFYNNRKKVASHAVQ